MTAKYLTYSALWLGVIVTVLFVAAGDVRWIEAWVFLSEYAITTFAIVVWLAWNDPALLRERFTAPLHRDQAVWDRAFLLFMTLAFIAWLVMMAFDARRFGWSQMPAATEALGTLAFMGGFFVIWLAFRVNTFAVPQVRIQADRRQILVSDGPYEVVRHPMYSGALLFFLGIPLILGSWFGLLAAPVFAMALVACLLGEERMLRRDLAGYEAYAARVRWRLMPGLW